MSKYPNWTEKEVETLKLVYPKLGSSEEILQYFPNRNIKAIALKASRLGIKVINNVRKGRSNLEYVELLKNTNFSALEEYNGSTTPILHKCDICKNEWNTRPQHVLKPGAKCPICSNKDRFISDEEVDSMLKAAGMLRLSEYRGSLFTIKLKHEYCGYIWDTKYSYIQQGSGCPYCNKGFGYLHKNNIPEYAYVYVLDIILWDGNRFLKVGVTSRDVSLRINEITSSIGIGRVCNIRALFNIKLSGRDTLLLEKELLDIRNNFDPNICFVGNTETLHEDKLQEVERIIHGFLQRNDYIKP